MISNSVFVMTVIDILIVGIVGYSLFAIPRQLQTVTEKGARKSQILAIVGLILFAFVYLADLATMHVLPWFMPISETMSIMADVHLEYSWWIALVIVACLSLSLVVQLISGRIPSSSAKKSGRCCCLPWPSCRSNAPDGWTCCCVWPATCPAAL